MRSFRTCGTATMNSALILSQAARLNAIFSELAIAV